VSDGSGGLPACQELMEQRLMERSLQRECVCVCERERESE
jgi:hypothetical protein